MRMSFTTLEEIERIKRESNIYKQTQRNSLGVAKKIQSNSGHWIELFNIGNVMLMRAMEIQMGHEGLSKVCELDSAKDLQQFLNWQTEPGES